MKIGIIVGSFKPIQAGHYKLIELAAAECDQVELYVSLSDRARPGEVPILGSDMARIWKEYVEKTLPVNVKVTYGGSPVKNAWEFLGKANLAASQDEFVIYGDADDVAGNFPDASLNKYVRDLYTKGQVKRRAVDRASTQDISGTQMRSFIERGDRTSFVKNSPQNVDANAIFDILSATAESKPDVKKTAKSRPVKKPS